MTTELETRASVSLWRIIPPLGIAQIIAWGSLYYSIAVLAAPMAKNLGLSEPAVFGGFTLALLLSGVVAPWVGRRIDLLGGRDVLSASAILAALAFAILAQAHSTGVFFAGWAIAGLAIGCGLYDPVMAALNLLVPGPGYRRAVTALTLIAGFASTVFWPLSHWLVEAWDWRTACACFALLHIAACLPLYRYAVPARSAGELESVVKRPIVKLPTDRRFAWLAASFALVSFAFSVLSAHLIDLLGHAGISKADAILVGALFGPMQVLARIVEFCVAPRIRAVTVGSVAFILMAGALVLLLCIDGSRQRAFLFAAFYGASNGILTIVRGSVPAELFGRAAYGALLGRLALPSFFAKALAPFSFSLLLAAGTTPGAGTIVLAVVGGAALLSYQVASILVSPQREHL